MTRAARGRALAGLAVGAALALGGCATAPAPGIEVSEQGAGLRADDLDVSIDGPVTVTFREITLKPGEGTGLHCHDGNLIAIVTQGTLTHYAPIYPTGVHEYQAGDAILEGPHYAHEGVNEGTEPVVLEVAYLIPEGYPLAETDLGKCETF